jgi:predicted 3-demethylubiquinone-9 3-methyltransferase (glyoxalase superfamily)
MTTTTITPFLWFDNTVPEAVDFYTSVFPDAKVEMKSDFLAIFEIQGQRFYALNGGPQFKFTEAVSFFISVDTQEEVDYYWDKLISGGGEPSMCGWLKDRYGFSWQVYPASLDKMLADPDQEKVQRVTAAFMQVDRRAFDIAELEAAFEGR